jgi:hypothetical protein
MGEREIMASYNKIVGLVKRLPDECPTDPSSLVPYIQEIEGQMSYFQTLVAENS